METNSNGLTSIGVGSILIAIGMSLGAFASHGLTGRIPPHMLEVFEKGVHYQLLAAGGLIVSGFLQNQGIISSKLGEGLDILFLISALLFSGSLYILSTSTSANMWIGMATPLGGVTHIAAWVVVAVTVLRAKSD